MVKRLFILTTCILGVAVQGWAFSSYYAKLTVTTNPSSGAGYVYVANAETDNPSYVENTSNVKSEDAGSSGGSVTFYAYAKPKRGYTFTGWTDAGTAKSGVAEMVYSTTRTASTSDNGTQEYSNLVANFKTASSFNVTYDAAEGISYTINYDQLSSGSPTIGSTFATYASDKVTLSAPTSTDTEAIFGGWYVGSSSNIKSYDETWTTTFSEATHVGAVFVKPYTVEFKNDNNATLSVTKGSETENVVGTKVTGVTPDAEFTVSMSNLASGYEFFGWYVSTAAGDIYLSKEESATFKVPATGTVYADIHQKDEDTTPIFTLGDKRFTTLSPACQSAATNDVIILHRSGTISNENATVPAGVTLLIPYDDANTTFTTMPPATTTTWTQPTVYRKLTLASSSNLTVKGNLAVGSTMMIAGGGSANPSGAPCGPTGQIMLNEGTEIIIGDGTNTSNLFCWGYILGEGKVTIKNASKIYEGMQFTDFRGGTCTSSMIGNDQRVFPLNQYYFQNVESYLNLEYGAEEHVTSYVKNSSYNTGDVTLIGTSDQVLFKMSKGSSVLRKYNPNTDFEDYTLYGTVALNQISVSILGYTATSESYTLPISNNMHINVGDGTTNGYATIAHETALFPGAQMNVAKGSSLTISGILYVYDQNTKWVTYPGNKATRFSPSWEKDTSGKLICPRTYTIAGLGAASMKVDGTVTVNGALYTTYDGDDTTAPAKIYSENNTGNIIFKKIGSDGTTYIETNNGPTYQDITYTNARLLNGDNKTYEQTSSLTAGTTVKYHYDATTPANSKWYCYNAEWKNGDETLKTENYRLDKPASSEYTGVLPTLEGKTFVGWTQTLSGDDKQTVTYTALFEAKEEAPVPVATHDAEDEEVTEKHDEITVSAPESVEGDYVTTVTDIADAITEDCNKYTVSSVDVTNAATAIYKDDKTSPATAKEIRDAIVTKTNNENTLVILPSTVTETKYLPEGKTAEEDKVETPNVIKDNAEGKAECKNLVLQDTEVFNSPTEFTADEITYERKTTSGSVTSITTLGVGKYATIYVPYVFNPGNFKVMKFASYENNIVNFEYVDADKIEANTPYIIRPNNGEDQNLAFNLNTSTDVSVTTTAEKTNAAFYGTYKELTLDGKYGYYGFSATTGTFKKANTTSGTKIKPFRAYFWDGTTTPTTARSASLGFTENGGKTTDIEEVLNAMDNGESLYDLNGHKVVTPESGKVYIMGGKKVMFK